MPTRPKQRCSVFGCSVLVTGGRCATHRGEAEAARGSAAARGYDRAWREQRRIEFLTDNPYCVDCGAEATVPDHDPIPRRELVRRGVEDPDADEHLVPRCTPCHNRKTAKTGR